MNCVADHLGHSLERTYYQVAPSVIQRATISCSVDPRRSRQGQNFKGRPSMNWNSKVELMTVYALKRYCEQSIVS